jgi:hypothetical protein
MVYLLPLLSGPRLVSLEPVRLRWEGGRLGALELGTLRLASVSIPPLMSSSCGNSDILTRVLDHFVFVLNLLPSPC